MRCIAGTIGLRYATQIATLTIDKCEFGCPTFGGLHPILIGIRGFACLSG